MACITNRMGISATRITEKNPKREGITDAINRIAIDVGEDFEMSEIDGGAFEMSDIDGGAFEMSEIAVPHWMPPKKDMIEQA